MISRNYIYIEGMAEALAWRVGKQLLAAFRVRGPPSQQVAILPFQTPSPQQVAILPFPTHSPHQVAILPFPTPSPQQVAILPFPTPSPPTWCSHTAEVCGVVAALRSSTAAFAGSAS